VPHDLSDLLVRIRMLVDDDANEPSERLLATIEHTLTDGYAHALALEGERLRIERQMGEAVTHLENEDEVETLAALAARLETTDRDLVRLRAVLVALRRRADYVRRAGAAAAC
jgi:diphthamide synthase (EF-2-diphthine--ammonia ligase)